MDGDIVFYIHGDAIEYGGELFSTGELKADDGVPGVSDPASG